MANPGVPDSVLVPGRQGPTPNQSGVSLPRRDEPVPLGTPSRARLLFDHSLAHVPALLMLIVVFWSSHLSQEQCNMRLLFPDAPKDTCTDVMGTGIAVLTCALGAMAWYTAYALRPLAWEIVSLVKNARKYFARIRLGASGDEEEERTPVLSAVATAVLRSVLVETFRLLCHAVSVAVIVAHAWEKLERGMHTQGMQQLAEACWLGIDDPRFTLSLWLGAGWALAELVAGSYQLFKLLPFIRTADEARALDEGDILGDYVTLPGRHDSAASDAPATASSASSGSHEDAGEEEDGDEFDEEELSLSELILLRSKYELEAQLGEPLQRLSAATISLWRIDSVLWNVGSCLLLSASFTLAQGCSTLPSAVAFSKSSTYAFDLFPPVWAMLPTLLALVVVHTAATSAWMLLLPRVGATSMTYSSLLVGLGLLCAALARWRVVD